jgi:hypothetical protein
MITASAAMASSLQWSLGLNLTSPMNRLADTFDSCFICSVKANESVRTVREEMAQQAIHCGMAYCTLRFLDRLGGNNRPIQSRFRNIGNLVRTKNNDPVETQLDSVFRILKEWPDVATESSMPEITKWTLYLIPCLDKTKMFNLSAEDSLEYFLHQFDGNWMTNLDHSAFANYLCCVITFLAPMDPGLMAQIDKR